MSCHPNRTDGVGAPASMECRACADVGAATEYGAAAAKGDEDAAALAILATEAAAGGVWIAQLQAGKDFATTPSDEREQIVFGAALNFSNLIYLVGDLTTRECYVIDPCWDLKSIHAYAQRCRMTIKGSVITHTVSAMSDANSSPCATSRHARPPHHHRAL